jgi:hypothetical protein
LAGPQPAAQLGQFPTQLLVFDGELIDDADEGWNVGTEGPLITMNLITMNGSVPH